MVERVLKHSVSGDKSRHCHLSETNYTKCPCSLFSALMGQRRLGPQAVKGFTDFVEQAGYCVGGLGVSSRPGWLYVIS